ncbi:MAG: glycosyltransferase [Pseudomonadota bacterium]
MFNYKSYADLSRDIAANLQKLPQIDIVVGVPKSGLIPAMMISSLKNVKFYDLDQFQFVFSARSGMRKYIDGTESNIRVLIVDDTVNTGAELRRTREKLAHLQSELELHFCAIYGTDPDAHDGIADTVLSYVPQPRFFQWNYRNHIIAQHAIFDMDGVLCVDPTNEQNDDGPAYLEFLSTATPLTIPVKLISAIATSRLEKYRPQTEEWLEKHGVQYRDLLMLDLPSAEERRRLRAHAPFKAEVYGSREEYLFVESNWKQAQFIARETDKAVICTENDVLTFGRDHLDHLEANHALPSIEAGAHENDLQRRVDLLVNRVIQTDPYAAYWIKQSGFRFDLGKIAEVSPFLKGRIVTGSLQDRKRDRERPEPSRNKKQRRILMISATFEVERGAGAAASSVRLRDSLIASGADVHTLSLDDFPNKDRARTDQPTAGTRLGFWNNYSDGDHWKTIRRRVLAIAPDCIILGAVDRGIVSMFDIARLDFPIVWVSRDNWAHTGGCLFKLQPENIFSIPKEYEEFLGALTCEGYKHGCSHCPALNDVRESAKARINFEFKRVVLNYRRDIVFAPISQWMADMLRNAPLTANHEIVPVGNPIDLSVVRRLEHRPQTIRQKLGLLKDDKIVLLAAHSLANPRKGLKHLLSAMAFDSRLSDVVFVRIGTENARQLSFPPSLRCHSLGFVESEEEKVAIYNEVDATLVPALQESLSVVASDSICCGTPVVAYNTSGLRTFLQHRVTGYLAEKFDADDLINGLCWVLYGGQKERMSEACLEQAKQSFDSEKNTKGLLQAVDVAIEKHKDLPEFPVELKTLASVMELLHEDLHFRADRVNHLTRRIKEVSATKDMNPNKLFDELENTRKKLSQSRKRVRELEARVAQQPNMKNVTLHPAAKRTSIRNRHRNRIHEP